MLCFNILILINNKNIIMINRWLFFDKSNCFGDSLVPLKMNILELDQPMSDNETYYSNYDPKANGLIRKDGLKKSLVFSMSNLTYTDSIRGLSSYADIARISLNEPYTDKQGVTYNNYGTYILRNFYEHPEYFKNSYSFIHTLCPGFYFELGDGLGLMAKFSQNEDLKQKLLATGDAYLVECAWSDKIWACGVGLYDSGRTDAGNWHGTNILGFTLMKVREHIKNRW